MSHIARTLCLALFSAVLFGQTPPAFRLGEEVVPVRYAVALKLSPPDDNFSGSVDVDVRIAQTTKVIWMQAAGLNVSRAEVRLAGQSLAVRVIMAPRNFLGIALDSPLPPGTATIHIDYAGKLSRNSSDGLFLNREGTDWYVFSQFEPISARAAFPCFDEPRFKTPWQLTLDIPKGNRAFSNTPEISSTEGPDGRVTVKFAASKPLPSYLVALAVGPIETVHAGTAGRNHVPVRILVPHGRAADAQFAARVTPEIVNRLEAYFGIPYPYDKLDSVALPLIYGFGAMENAGLVTYAQSLILAKPSEQSPRFERDYISVAMHELAHQWFGDLVTLKWWNDTWLNEAFATWTEQKLVEEWKPEWNQETSDVLETQGAMADDALISARAVRQPIRSENDIANAFDSITYQKGAAVIRMFERWAGADRFQQGVRLYLNRHAWGSATAEEFLADVSAGAGVEIAKPFMTFLDQPGVPLVSLKLECGANGPAVTAGQRRFLPLGSPGAPPQIWQIPLCVRYGGGVREERACTLLTSPEGSLKLAGQVCPAWVDGNANESGYYRAEYGGDLLNKLLGDRGRQLTDPERAGLLGDANALMRGGGLPAARALGMAAEFAGDPARQIVTSAADLAGSVDAHLVPDSLRPAYQRYICDTFGARARQLGWKPRPGESEDDRLLRPVLVALVARTGEDRQLIGEAQQLARAWLEDHSAVRAEVVNAVLNTAAQFGGATLFDRFLAAAKAEKGLRDRQRLISALGSFRSPVLAGRALALILDTAFDPRETVHLLFAPLQYEATRDLPFEFVQKNFDALVARLPRGVGSDAGAMLPDVGSAFCSREKHDEVKAFFADRIRHFTGGPRNLAQVLESIDVCAAVAKAQTPSVAEFLNNAK